MPMQRYHPRMYPEVEAFAKKLKWFGYVKEIINWHSGQRPPGSRWHSRKRLPGSCWVWRQHGRLVAFCGLRLLNPQDAWLYGMRVTKDLQNKGIARRFTQELFRVARRTGRTWVGFNTYHYQGKPSPIYTIAERLGMELDAVHAVDSFWKLPKRISGPRPRRFTDIFLHYQAREEKTLFFDDHGWLWYRLVTQRRRQVNEGGFMIADVPVHIARYQPRGTTFNLLDHPSDFAGVLPTILSRATAKKKWVTVNYPAAWSRRFRRAVRELVPGVKMNKQYYPSAWRIYGKYLK
ncbi:MAG: GNAT family N-acetyltransferase [candidate division WOR-3 bacterium]|nr:MAG: GNAT family N-acetyltransferase [candidate division WOR-3 bacterium]